MLAQKRVYNYNQTAFTASNYKGRTGFSNYRLSTEVYQAGILLLFVNINNNACFKRTPQNSQWFQFFYYISQDNIQFSFRIKYIFKSSSIWPERDSFLICHLMIYNNNNSNNRTIFTEHILCARHCSKHFSGAVFSKPRNSLWGGT